jgi:type II secretory pathway pseudopilin PulG
VTNPAQRRRAVGELGAISLVEVVVCLLLLGILGGVIVPLVTAFSREDSSISQTYDVVDQLLEPAQQLATFIHEAIAPAPVGSTTAAWSVFTSNTGPNEVQFTADVGAYGSRSDAGPFTVYGPALVTVAVTTSGGQRTLVGTLQPAEAGTCPGVSTGNACHWGAAQPLFTVADLADGTSTQPVFSYLEPGGTLTSSPATNCTTTPGGCPLDTVQAVTFNLVVSDDQALPGGAQSEATILAPAYQPSVG